MADVKKCPLCGWDATITQLGDADHVKCELCGEFKITRTLLSVGASEGELLHTLGRTLGKQTSGEKSLRWTHTIGRNSRKRIKVHLFRERFRRS